MKACTKCGETKPLEAFGRHRTGRHGRRPDCKSCVAEYQRSWYAENREDALTQKRQYHAENREKKRQRDRRYREENPEQVRDQVREASRRYREKNPEKKAEHGRRYREENLEKERQRSRRYYEQNREQARERERRSREKNPEIKRQATRRRRAKKLNAEGNFTCAEWLELCAAYGNVCLCCGERKPLTADHVIPLCRGGSNDIANIQPLCLSCNCSKQTKTIDYRQQGSEAV